MQPGFSFMLSLAFRCFCSNQCNIATEQPIAELDLSAFLLLHLFPSPRLTCLPAQTERVSKEFLCSLLVVLPVVTDPESSFRGKSATTAADCVQQ